MFKINLQSRMGNRWTAQCCKQIYRSNLPVTLESYGQEINDETYAICKADILIKSKDGKQAENIRNGSTLSDEKFPKLTFDYILSNPPFGREWKTKKLQ